ncbi:MAG: hypothetical protein QFX35_03755 [Candidatus Verstraetearchaeota archaeon]|nr:hypothetical protein [Candidatus Verstraetearchaeota archaeon]
MACFIVPMILGVVTTVLAFGAPGLAKRLKLNLLNAMLWGGVVLLAAEHVWHGEITPFPPYLTAMANPLDTAAMLSEMATVGTSMAFAISATWAASLAVIRTMTRSVKVTDRLSPLSNPITSPH